MLARRAGFTLIELLVVIAIIAILAAILFPVFARARENARRSSCQSNLKQISLGVLQYVQDYDERYPMLWNNDTLGTQGNVFWPNLLQPYAKSVQVFSCPSQKKTGTTLLKAGGWTTADNANYIINIAIVGRGNANIPILVSKIATSADVFLLWDGDAGNNGNNFQSDYTSPGTVDALRPGLTLGSGPSSVPAPGSVRGLHLGGENYAYCDGHVKWYNRESVVWDSVGTQPSAATDARFLRALTFRVFPHVPRQGLLSTSDAARRQKRLAANSHMSVRRQPFFQRKFLNGPGNSKLVLFSKGGNNP